MTDAADEAVVAQSVRQKVIFSARFRRFYPRVISELIVHYITGLFLRREDISVPEGATAKLELKRAGLLDRWVTVEFEIISDLSMIDQAALCDDVYRLFLRLHARQVKSEFTRIEEE